MCLSDCLIQENRKDPLKLDQVMFSSVLSTCGYNNHGMQCVICRIVPPKNGGTGAVTIAAHYCLPFFHSHELQEILASWTFPDHPTHEGRGRGKRRILNF